MSTAWRKTTQTLAPSRHTPTSAGQYDLYPAFPVPAGQVQLGWDAVAAALDDQRVVILDGFGGVLWDNLWTQLAAALTRRGRRAVGQAVAHAVRPAAEIEALIAPFLGGDDPLFGRRFTGALADFFDPAALRALRPDPTADLNIVYGVGAALAGWDGQLIYVDVPKNEIQFRARAGSVTNLGGGPPADSRLMYKRFYFVDWPALNAHKAALLPRVAAMVDAQRPDEPAIMAGSHLRAALDQMSHNYFRVRPWFEPGPWGGQWIKQHIPELPQSAINYAWSFELIAPENGLALQSDGALLEVSFDCLMYHAPQAVLGASAARFGCEFPIRYDFLDTFAGGNLSVQCHPRREYIRQHFGETFTQDECYYILDCGPQARVYLGFQAGVDPAAFRAALEHSFSAAQPLDVARFVHTEPVRPHDLFLIPNGTIHCSGADNLVLEISATPYIFTFKMYDWMRLDLDGRPRPLNIARAFENLCFERQGERVRQELVAHPRQIAAGPDWTLTHLPTHVEHFYDVHRWEFASAVTATTNGSPHVLSLVAGTSVVLETAGGLRQRFNYAETFVIPAAAGQYRLVNEGAAPARVVKTFVKPEQAGREA
jgi:mannose-6-phosphate isomerase class I